MAFSLKKLASGMFSRLLLNQNFEKIEAIVNDKLLHREGDGSSVMKKDLDMDSNDILNVKELYLSGGRKVATISYVDTQDIKYSTEGKTYTDKRVNEAISNLQLDLASGDVNTARYQYTAGQRETSITVPFNSFSAYDVFINGVHQTPMKAYTVSGNTFSFSEPLQEGDDVYFLLGMAMEITEYTSISDEVFISDAGQDAFTLTNTELVNTNIMVFLNGVKQLGGAYTYAGTDVVFTEPLQEGDLVEVMAFSKIQQAVTEANPVLLMDQTITKNTVITPGKNGLSVDPIIASGVTVTVSNGSTWAIVGE